MGEVRKRGQVSEPGRFPLWKGMLTALLAVSVFFGLAELALLALGVRPFVGEEDPFVDFASSSPLFVESMSQTGERQLETAPGKRLFNEQRFPVAKAPGTPVSFS